MRADRLGIGKLLSMAVSKNNGDKNRVFKKKDNSFIIFILLLINFFSAFYFYGIGRPRYFVRTDFVVRKSGNDSASTGTGLSSLLGLGNASSIEDARYLQTFLESPQVLKGLEQEINFKTLYEKKPFDFYAGINKNSSSEEVYDFFRRQISIRLEEASGVITITSLGFSPSSAFKLNTFLVQEAERFVNKLNKDIYKIQYQFAKKEVLSNRNKLNEAISNLQDFQKANQIIDDDQEVVAYGGIILALESELAKQKIELATMKRIFIDPQAPEIQVLNNQIKSLEDQIKTEREDLVSSNGKNLTQTSLKLTQLKSNISLKEDLYKSSLGTAEAARLDSLQQQRFMAILRDPLYPESEWKYWRHKGFITFFAILFVGYALTKFIIGMTDSHVT